jgi:hypothetical protein
MPITTTKSPKQVQTKFPYTLAIYKKPSPATNI